MYHRITRGDDTPYVIENRTARVRCLRVCVCTLSDVNLGVTQGHKNVPKISCLQFSKNKNVLN